MRQVLRTAMVYSVVVFAHSLPAFANEPFPAKLAGHAVLPAESFIEAPADAPVDLKTSGKYVSGRRVDALGSVMGKSADRPTGVSTPFKGQPVQGHSGIKRMTDGSFWIITDNGFGSKTNSPDSMLYLNRYKIDWNTGAWDRQETIFLHDPDKKVPFRIVHEGTDKRYLTGSDFDIEGFQWIGETLWIGEEFGPYVLKADKAGRILGMFETMSDGRPVRSPDHYAVQSPGAPNGQYTNVTLRRSKGFEGFAASKDGKFLYAMLEGAIWDAEKKANENIDGKDYLRVLEFSVADEKWTGRHWKYVLDANTHAIGDFNMIDGTTGLVIERDNGEGTADKACLAGEKRPDCFHDLAKFKRVVKIEMTEANVGGPVRKIGHIDLMNIQDPDKKARKPLTNGALAFPFFTIENVDIVDERHIVVGNDNNLPFSSSRDPNKADDNELILLDVADLLKAK
jgi:hypothetical protein